MRVPSKPDISDQIDFDIHLLCETRRLRRHADKIVEYSRLANASRPIPASGTGDETAEFEPVRDTTKRTVRVLPCGNYEVQP